MPTTTLFVSVSVLSFSCLCAVSAAATEPAQPGPWEVVSQNDRVVVKARSHPGRAIKEVLAEGVVDAPAWVLKNVVDDIEGYTNLIPFTTAASVVGTDENGDRISFQRLEMPFLQKREYVVRVFDDSSVNGAGRHVYKMGWTRAADRFATVIDKAAIVPPVNDGSWTFEERADGRTLATFHLFVDPSGSLPPVVVNIAQQVTLGQYLGNLERLATQERYQKKPQSLVRTGLRPAPAAQVTAALVATTAER